MTPEQKKNLEALREWAKDDEGDLGVEVIYVRELIQIIDDLQDEFDTYRIAGPDDS